MNCLLHQKISLKCENTTVTDKRILWSQNEPTIWYIIILFYHAYVCVCPCVVIMPIYIGTTPTKCPLSRLTSNMKYYQDHLKSKYNALELVSPDEMLDCFSPQYIDLTLIKDDKTQRIRQRGGPRSVEDGNNVGVGVKQDIDSDCVTLSEALDVEKLTKKIITIEGGPGMGKTTLAINICKCWARNELLQNYNAVILLTLRDPEIQEAKTIGDLLLLPSAKMRDNVLEDIMKVHGEGICFIFEGFDELPYNLHNSSLFTKVTEKLSRCMVVYTSRPYSLSSSIKASQTIKINGFMENSVDEYILKTFENEPDGDKMALELQSQVHSNPEIKKILNVPINVAIICLIFFYSLKLPDKLTELYTLLCLRLILRHINKRTLNVEQVKELTSLNDLPEEISKEFSHLCYIAYKGVCNKKIIFSSSDLHDIGIIRDINGLGLLLVAPSTSVYGIKKSYNFFHMTLQEFCAAWHLSKLSVEEQTKHFSCFLYSLVVRDNIRGIKSNMVWKFYSGISHLTNIDIEKLILPHESGVNKKLLKIIELLYEADDDSLCQKVGNYFNGDLDLDYHHFDSDYNIHALQYFLKKFRGNVEFITFGSFGHDDTNRKIFDVIVKSLSLSSLSNVDLGFKILLAGISTKSFCALANLLKAHQHLIVELYFEEFHKKYLSFLPQIVCSNKVLEILCIKFIVRLFGIECISEGADWLESCKSLHLQRLGLSHGKLDSIGIEKIGKMLSLNNSIFHIDLSYNKIDDDGVEMLTNHLKNNHTLQSLDLTGNNITPVGAVCLRDIVNNLQYIKLSYNCLGHVGIYLILEAITDSMEHIDLHGRDASYSYKSFAGILDKVKSINFTLPDDDHEDCKVLYESLANAEILEQLEVSGLSNLNHYRFLQAIEQNNNVDTLKLNYDDFTDEFGAHLAEFIKSNESLSSLSVSYSKKKSAEGLLLIADSLTENTAITCLNIISNTIYGHVRADCVLQFLYEIKQADTLKRLTLDIGVVTLLEDNMSDFYKKLNISIQQINYSRSIKGIDSLEFNFYYY